MKLVEIERKFPRLFHAIECVAEDAYGFINMNYDIPNQPLIEAAARAADFFGDKTTAEVMTPEDVPETARFEWEDGYDIEPAYVVMAVSEVNYMEYLAKLVGDDGRLFSELMNEIFDGIYSDAIV